MPEVPSEQDLLDLAKELDAFREHIEREASQEKEVAHA